MTETKIMNISWTIITALQDYFRLMRFLKLQLRGNTTPENLVNNTILFEIWNYNFCFVLGKVLSTII